MDCAVSGDGDNAKGANGYIYIITVLFHFLFLCVVFSYWYFILFYLLNNTQYIHISRSFLEYFLYFS